MVSAGCAREGDSDDEGKYESRSIKCVALRKLFGKVTDAFSFVVKPEG